ncbi:MAG: PDZ domain-containing protein, partial [Candidatus Brocadiae bacterium]|nr:PDZ domain-containing protein [Candidatus Brocadiia bacterium]
LPQAQQRPLMEHLSRCGQCCAELAELQRASAALRLAIPEIAPRQPYLSTARLERLVAGQGGRPRPVKIITFRRFLAAAAVAAILVSAFFIVGDVRHMWEEEQQEPLLVLDWLGVAVAQHPGEGAGVQVKAVLEDSPADAAGIRPADVLLQVGGRVVDAPAVLVEHVIEAAPGRTVDLKLRRGDRIQIVPVEVDWRPLLMWAGPPRAGEGVVRLRWRKTVRAYSTVGPGPGQRGDIERLVEENRRLRSQLEEARKQLARSVLPPERDQD